MFDFSSGSTNGRSLRVVDANPREDLQQLADEFGRFWRGLEPLMLQLARRLAASTLDVDELVRDVRLAAWKQGLRVGGFSTDDGLWFTVIKNKAIDHQRALLSRARRIQAVEEWSKLVDTVGPGVSTCIELEEWHHALMAALARLPREQSQPISLAFLDGLTHTEVAKSLGLPIGTAKARIRRGLARLRADLARSGACLVFQPTR